MKEKRGKGVKKKCRIRGWRGNGVQIGNERGLFSEGWKGIKKGKVSKRIKILNSGKVEWKDENVFKKENSLSKENDTKRE